MKRVAISAVIVKAYPLITAPLFIYYLSSEEFGALDFAYYLMSLGCILLTLGINNGYARYAIDNSLQINQSVRKFTYLVASILLIVSLTLISLVIIIVLEIKTEEWIPNTLQTSTFYLVLYVASGALAHSSLTAERFSLNTTMLMVTTVVIYTLPVVALVASYYISNKIDVTIVLAYQTACNILAYLLSFYSSICKIEIKDLIFSIKKYITYSFPLLFALVGESIIYLAGRLYLSRFHPEGLDEFAIASRLASITLILNFFIAFIYHPIYYREHKNIKFQEYWKKLYSFFIATYSLCIAITPLIMPSVWRLLGNSQDLASIHTTSLILIANMVAGLQIFHLGMHVKEQTSLVGMIYLTCIPITIALNFFLIETFVVIGAGLALVITTAFISTPYIYLSNKYSEINLTLDSKDKICITTAITYFIATSIEINSNAALSLIFILLYIFSTAAISLRRKHNEYNPNK